MVPGVAGGLLTVIARVLAVLVKQLLFAVTLTLPEALPKVIVTEVVTCRPVMAAAAGTLPV